jgi:hypothetical protein
LAVKGLVQQRPLQRIQRCELVLVDVGEGLGFSEDIICTGGAQMALSMIGDVTSLRANTRGIDWTYVGPRYPSRLPDPQITLPRLP